MSTVNLFLIKQIAGKPLVFLNCMLSYLEIINHYYLSKTLYYVDDMILQGKMCSKIQFQCSRPLTRCHVNAFNKIAIMVYNITLSLLSLKCAYLLTIRKHLVLEIDFFCFVFKFTIKEFQFVKSWVECFDHATKIHVIC